jgi:tight adherence protein B
LNVSGGLAFFVMVLLWLKDAPLLLALFGGLLVGAGLPHVLLNFFIARRINKFTANFPDAIELLVRGLKSGLPVGETLSVVAKEVPGPVGEEFKLVTEKVKIGKSMEESLQETADRLGTAEFQFFVITLAIQRETGGNLAETLANLADVLRKRAQMKLKILCAESNSEHASG